MSEAAALVYGCRVHARVCSYLFAPASGGSDRVDAAVVNMFHGIETLRADGERLLFTPLVGMQHAEGWKRIGDAAQRAGAVPGLVPDLSTPGIAEAGEHAAPLRLEPRNQRVYLSQSVRLAAPFHATFIERVRGGGTIHASKPGEKATVHVPILLPMREVTIEVLVHHSITGWPEPEAISVDSLDPHTHEHPNRFALECAVERVPAASAPASLGDWSLNYRQALARGASELGHPLEAFSCVRITVPHPMVQSVLMLRWALPAPQGTQAS
jgi:hypothetical protein